MKKILIVDDESFMLKLTDRMLRDDYATVCASSAKEAAALYEEEKPDLVLSDLLMPELSGYDLQALLQEKDIGKMVPFVFMTADTNDESENKGFALGAADYIRKPLKRELLLKRVKRIFEQVDQMEHLQRVAAQDGLTGLLNKHAATEELTKACERLHGELMMIDLDSFKLVNDLYGHEMGDRILRRFGELLKKAVRENDIVGRMGGDEFIAFCQNMSGESGIESKTAFLNEKLLASAKEYMGENMEIPLGVSIGAVSVPQEGMEFETLFKKADSALYEVKQAGKHGFKLYQSAAADAEGERSLTGAESIRLLFKERNIGAGAWVVDREHFQTTYRFLERFIRNYAWEIRLVVFSFAPEEADNAKACEGVADAFVEKARQKLRCSDLLLKYSENTVMALLMKVDEERCEIPIARVLEFWGEEKERFPGVKMSWEINLIEG